MSSSETTTDHDTIREWTESRGGRPSIVPTEGAKGRKGGGVLRLDFGPKEENFEEVSWDDFFAIFDQSNLAFLYQDKTADGKESRFNKFVERTGNKANAAKGKPEPKPAAPKRSRGSARSSSRAAGRTAHTKAELMDAARKKNIPGRSRMSKEKLEKALG